MDALTLVRIFPSLLIVVALILGCAWLARRNGVSGMRAQRSNLTIRSRLAVGPRGMQIMVVDVEDVRLVVGVTPGGINVLHTLAQTDPLPNYVQTAQSPAPASFSSIFRSLLRSDAK